MLRDLFPRHYERYEKSRFGAELETFAIWLAEQGHLRYPLRLHLHRVREVLGRSDRFHPGAAFHEADLRQAFVVPGPCAYLYLCTGRIFTRFLAATGRLVPIEQSDAVIPGDSTALPSWFIADLPHGSALCSGTHPRRSRPVRRQPNSRASLPESSSLWRQEAPMHMPELKVMRDAPALESDDNPRRFDAGSTSTVVVAPAGTQADRSSAAPSPANTAESAGHTRRTVGIPSTRLPTVTMEKA